jgi:hypothetical protein
MGMDSASSELRDASLTNQLRTTFSFSVTAPGLYVELIQRRSPAYAFKAHIDLKKVSCKPRRWKRASSTAASSILA